MKTARWVFLYLLLAAAAFVLMSLRRSDLLSNPQFWAEDGSVFFTQLIDGTRAALFQPYAGYPHLVPRLVAASATLFRAHRAPLIFSLAARTIDALCCSLFLLPCYRHLVRSDALRAILCLLWLTASSPTNSSEFLPECSGIWPWQCR